MPREQTADEEGIALGCTARVTTSSPSWVLLATLHPKWLMGGIWDPQVGVQYVWAQETSLE